MPYNDFIIDKITNSIEDSKTGKSNETLVLPVTIEDVKGILIKDGCLDDIGFVGTQEKISAPERRRIQKETGKIIEAYRNAMKNAKGKKIKKVS